jgi:hypothetical protein
MPAGTDARPLFKGLPDDRCSAPHWGYVTKGQIRIIYADREEVLRGADLYHLPPGHTAVVEEDYESVESSGIEHIRWLAVAGLMLALGVVSIASLNGSRGVARRESLPNLQARFRHVRPPPPQRCWRPVSTRPERLVSATLFDRRSPG